MSLQRAENVVYYLIRLNKSKPIAEMDLKETEYLLKRIGFNNLNNTELARHKLLQLINYLT